MPRHLTIALLAAFALGTATACTITEDHVKGVLIKEGYTDIALGPPTNPDFRHSFTARMNGNACEGNITVSGISWAPASRSPRTATRAPRRPRNDQSSPALPSDQYALVPTGRGSARALSPARTP
jgi:hypothetical protein